MEAQQQQQQQQPRGAAFHEPTVTLSTLAAFDVLNEMFGSGDSAPMQKRPNQDSVATEIVSFVPPPRAALAAPSYEPLAAVFEPTVTISTRAAFDALNDMFSDQLPHESGREKQRKVVRDAQPMLVCFI
jgi:hypothetical protein